MISSLPCVHAQPRGDVSDCRGKRTLRKLMMAPEGKTDSKEEALISSLLVIKINLPRPSGSDRRQSYTEKGHTMVTHLGLIVSAAGGGQGPKKRT